MRPRTTRVAAPVICLAAALAWPAAARADETPHLDWNQPVRCLKTPAGVSVRVQCKGAGREMQCLVAPNQASGGGELQRVQPCATVDTSSNVYERLVAEGATMIGAVAEAPPGYARSEKGRAFQVTFDMLNRVYLGAGWVPTFQPSRGKELPPGFPFGRGQAEIGLHISSLSTQGRSRHDLRILEGTATFKDLEVQGLLLAYDYQHVHRRPAFFLSTFVGEPRVFEVNPPIGWGFRLIEMSDRPPAFRDTLDVEFAEVHMSWNPWQTEDMYNHLRLEAGVDFGEYWRDRSDITHGLGTGSFYVGFTSAIRTRFAIGDGGRHYIFGDVSYRRPTLIGGPTGAEAVNRGKATIAYEGIFLAVNDQPLSLRVAVNGAARDDPRTGTRGFEMGFSVGLRFSFWAPARVAAELPPLEAP